jgi:HEPN domain-containing protein
MLAQRVPPDALDANAPARWLKNARADLALASITLPEGVQYEQLCFHAQQAAEKGLKAVLLACNTSMFHLHTTCKYC